jgi:Sec-independent protein translocase protein TatA
MFGINLSEFVVILCIVVIFVRPKDLPRFFYNIGKVYGQLKDTYRGFIKTRDEVLQDLKSEIDSELQPTANLDDDPSYSDPYDPGHYDQGHLAHFTPDAETPPAGNKISGEKHGN